MDKILLSLDYSTSCTGWSKFSLDTKELLSYGEIKPDFKKNKGTQHLEYPEFQVLKLERLAEQIIDELLVSDIDTIVIEEINNGGISGRLSQKVLDGGHFILLKMLPKKFLSKVKYINSDGKQGWRSASGLKLQLSESDRLQNKEVRKMNRKMKKGKKIPVIDVKQLAVNYVNEKYKLTFTIDDNDICDSIGLGTHYLLNVLGKPK